ncbi:hypothetical protein F4556_002387 [Kitasatospora gansuensis]|uniref:Uncharacterized protein n=1 Tax=Kitasatospora gansuensis TaxID=258050 RepID=A0A7W7SB61_9ACTN|nr:hypothetical protein [Kitasatospora gansuensis]MBB4946852.1 hypothetical protein [Kitasatospora gansuensis]
MTGRRLRALLGLRVVRITDPVNALELVRPDGTGWYLCPMPARREPQPEPAPLLTVHGAPVLTGVVLPGRSARP